jgi:hypothetical protein
MSGSFGHRLLPKLNEKVTMTTKGREMATGKEFLELALEKERVHVVGPGLDKWHALPEDTPTVIWGWGGESGGKRRRLFATYLALQQLLALASLSSLFDTETVSPSNKEVEGELSDLGLNWWIELCDILDRAQPLLKVILQFQ